jgi:hypothetical protein
VGLAAFPAGVDTGRPRCYAVSLERRVHRVQHRGRPELGAARAAGAALLAFGIAGGCEAEPEPVPTRDYCEPDVVDGLPIECCRICSIGQDVFGGCDRALPPSEWPSRSETWNEWRPLCGSEASVSAGRCSSGISYVAQHWPPGSGETRYFDADGHFLALEGYIDVSLEICGFDWYWPKRVECGTRMQEMGCPPVTMP